MLVQFGNNWIQKIPLTAKLDLACGLAQFWLSLELFSSNYFQIGQHVVLLHNYTNHASWKMFISPITHHVERSMYIANLIRVLGYWDVKLLVDWYNTALGYWGIRVLDNRVLGC